MKLLFQVLFLLSMGILKAVCTLDECGPPLGMPNYLCADGETTVSYTHLTLPTNREV